MNDETQAMLVQYSVLAWQSFVRTGHLLLSKLAGLSWTSHLLSSILAEIISVQATLAWKNPARTNQFLETLN